MSRLQPSLSRELDAPIDRRRLFPSVFAAAFGGFLGLALLKFGNPPIMEKWTATPTNIYEFLLASPWPIGWAYRLLAVVTLLGVFVVRRGLSFPKWLAILPLLWLAWQVVATATSIDTPLSNPTLVHFVACVVCFGLGLFALSRVERLGCFWIGLLCGFALVIVSGFEQHFGGLEATRKYFYLYLYSHSKEVAPEYLKKLSSDRIFSTLFYPNALAGALLLLLPPMLGLIWRVRRSFTAAAGWFLAALVTLPALACLYWSGSKGGWLLMLGLAVVAFLKLPINRRYKTLLIAALVVGGGFGFAAKYAGFFHKGATSVVARFDYWRAALHITGQHPLLGTGPGTFARTYEQIKRPEAEMARLVHNDYVEQASDSGIPGLVLYTAFILGALVAAGRRLSGNPIRGKTATKEEATNVDRLRWLSTQAMPGDAAWLGAAAEGTGGPDWFAFSVWLGLLGWAVQSCLEFDLYLPALAWPAFVLLGWLTAQTAATPERLQDAGVRPVSNQASGSHR